MEEISEDEESVDLTPWLESKLFSGGLPEFYDEEPSSREIEDAEFLQAFLEASDEHNGSLLLETLQKREKGIIPIKRPELDEGDIDRSFLI